MTTSHVDRPLAIAVPQSGNRKIGECATTYAAQQSCPSGCVFRDGGGCYAESGLLAIHTRVLNAAAGGASAFDVARAEADAIDAMDVIPGRPMRLHTVGDCATDETARLVSAAAFRYVARGGGPVWTYTHGWRDVDRDAWGDVNVLASCETPDDVEEARLRGYAAALVVDTFADRKLYTIDASPSVSGGPVKPSQGAVRFRPAEGELSCAAPVSVLPCPAQTRNGNVTCASCRLCMSDSDILGRGYAIGFEVHGTALAVKKARLSLERPHDESRKLTSRDHALRYRDEHGDWPTSAVLSRLADVTRGSATEMLTRLRAAA